MINLGIQHSTERPQEVEITSNAVFVATNIESYSKEIEEHVVNGFQYNYTQYTLSEYLAIQNANIASL